MDHTLFREEIYTLYKEKVSGYVRGKVPNSQDAEDLVSCVFLKVYQNLDSYDERKASLSTWIYRITQNTVTDWFRTNKIQAELSEMIPAEVNTEEQFLQEEMLDALADALEKMDVRERDLIILHYYNGLTLKEIVGLMNLSYATVKIIHKSALGHLRQEMSGWE